MNNYMKNLILKDMILAKMSIIITMIVCPIMWIVWTFTAEISLIAVILNTITTMIFVYICIQGINGYDDLNKTYKLIASLPIDRYDIVKSKYMQVIIYMIVGEIELSLIALIIKLLKSVHYNILYINFITILISSVFILIYYSIYYPLYFKLGSSYISYINKIVFIVLILSPSAIFKFVKIHSNINIVKSLMFFTNYKAILMVLLCSILMFTVSLKISQRIYIKRDLV